MQPTLYSILIFTLFASTACSAEVASPEIPTPTPLVIITATLPPTRTPRPTATLEPATPTEPVTPAEGQTISQLNVRSAPSAESDLLGTVDIFAKVQIVGKDPSGAWWMISYPDSPTGTGWVTVQFVQATNTENVPVFKGQTGANENAPVTDSAPEGEAGPTVESGSAAVPSPATDPELASAFQDNDSAQSPAVSIALSKISVRTFTYDSDLSSPTGDPDDWVQFRLEGETGRQTTVSVVINCTGSGALGVELMQNNSALQGWQDLTCGHPNQLVLSLFVGAPYTLHLSPMQTNDIQKYISYTVIVTLQ